MHRHHQHLVDLAEIRLQPFHRRLRIQHNRVLHPESADPLELVMEIAIRLHMNLNRLRTSRGELLKIQIGTRHHEMHVPVEVRRHALTQGDDVRTERQVRHEVRIHDVDVQRLGGGRLRTQNLLPQLRIIRSQQRR